jgi:N-glycosylase/DNA lyase
MNKKLLDLYAIKKQEIKDRLSGFKQLNEKEQYKEMVFCLLTPQSNAIKCWEAVEKLFELNDWNRARIVKILKKHTRFHNNKTKYVLESENMWKEIKKRFEDENKIALRNYIADKVKGYGLKEASHFLRNIGKSENKIAILDRHILRNLKELNIIKDEKIKNKKSYFDIENKFIKYSNKINIPIDELDLLFWSKENGEIFK